MAAVVPKALGVKIALVGMGIILLPAVRSTSSGLSKIAAGLTAVGSALGGAKPASKPRAHLPATDEGTDVAAAEEGVSGRPPMESSPSLDVTSVTDGFIGISRGLFSVGKGLASAAPGFHHMGNGLEACAPGMRHVGDGCASVGANLGDVSNSFQALAAGLNHMAAGTVCVGLAYIYALHGLPALLVGLSVFLCLVMFLRTIMARNTFSNSTSKAGAAASGLSRKAKASVSRTSQTG